MSFKTVLSLFILYIILKTSSTHSNEFEQRDITNMYRNNLKPLISKMDDNIEACDNFFEHVCNGYDKQRKRSGVFWVKGNKKEFDNIDSNVPPFLYNKEDYMRFFNENYNDFATTPGGILRNLYSDCKYRNHYDVIHGVTPSRWTRMLYEIEFLAQKSYVYRQFPFVHFKWHSLKNRYNLNWITLAAQFASHGIQALIKIFFAESTIYIAPAVEPNSCLSLDEVKMSIIPVLGKRNTQIATIIGRELWMLCQQLASEEELDMSKFKFNDTIPLEESYFEAFFISLNLTEIEVDEARLIPINLPHLQRSLMILMNTEPRIVFNYIIWYAYKNLEYEDCYQLTEEFEDMLLSEYWQWNVFARYFSRDAVIASYMFKTARFQKLRKQILMRRDWDKFLFKKILQKDFNIERMIRNYSSTFLTTAFMMEIYEETALEEGYFYGNLLSLRRQQLRATFYQPIVDDEDLNHPKYFLRQFLHFTILILKQPLFHYFASQGFELWKDSDLLYNSDGYFTALDCLELQTLLQLYNDNHIEPGPSIYTILNAEEVERLFRFHVAFFESLRDYRFWLSGESFAFAEDFILEYFQMDSKRVFFYATAQLYCDRNDYLYSLLINRSFMNLPEFAVAFNCSEDTPMNPTVKCMLKNCDQ